MPTDHASGATNRGDGQDQGVRASDAVENRLDALLDLHEREQARANQKGQSDAAQESPIDRLRKLVMAELIGAFAQVEDKYQAKGVEMSFEPKRFLEGGRDIRITITFAGVGMRLDGVVTHNAIAFTQTHFTKTDRSGVTSSGPSLRMHDLDATMFRNFVCEQMTQLIQSVLRQRTPV